MPAPTAPTTTALVRVLTADDHRGFRATARGVLAATPGFVAVGEAACGEDAVALAAALRPDVVLMDVHMPGIGGIEALRRIRTAGTGDVLVLISVYEPEQLPVSAWRCGATAILGKGLLRPSLLTRLWARASGAPVRERPLTSAELDR